MGSCLLKNCTGTKQEDQCSNILAWFAFTFMVVTAVTVLFNIVIIAPQTLEPVSFGFIAPMACGFLSLVFYVGATRDCRWQTLFLVLSILVMVGVSVASPALTSNHIVNANTLTAVTGVGAVVGASAFLEFNSKHIMEEAEPLLKKEAAPKVESKLTEEQKKHLQFKCPLVCQVLTLGKFKDHAAIKLFKEQNEEGFIHQIMTSKKIMSNARETLNEKGDNTRKHVITDLDAVLKTELQSAYKKANGNLKTFVEKLQYLGGNGIGRRLLAMMK